MALGRPGTLRAQLALLTFGGVLVATAFVTWEALSTRRLLRQRALAETRLLASQTAQAVKEGLGGAQELVLSFSEWSAARAHQAEECSAYAARLLAASSRYSNIGAADTAGDMFCSGAPLREATSLAAEPWFQRTVREGVTTIGHYQLGLVTGRRVLRVSAPIRDLRGRISGVAFATLDLVELTSRVVTTALPPGASLTVLDPDGVIILRHPEPERWIGERGSDSLLQRFARDTAGQVEATGVDGQPRIFSFTRVPLPGEQPGLLVSVGFHRRDVYAPAEAQGARAALVAAVALTLLVLGFWVSSRYLVLDPLESLARQADQLARGEVPRGERPALGGELGQVATALDQAGRRILAGQAQFAGIIDSAMDAIVTVDEGQRIVLFNPAAERSFGYSRAEAIGQPLDLLIPQAQRGRHQRHLHDFAFTGTPGKASRSMGAGSRLRGRHADGHEFPIEASISLLRTENGRFFTAILRDITERLAYEASLAERAAELEAVLAASPLAVIWIGTDLSVTGWFGAATEMFGWTREEVLGRPLCIVPPGLEEEYLRLRTQVFAGHPFTGVETRRLRKNGQLLPVSISTAPLRDATGAVVGLVATYEDVSIRRAHEADRERLLEEQAQLAEELRALHGRLVAVREEERGRIAREIHDQLGSALTALKMDAAWLRRQHAEAPREKVEGRLGGMLELLDETIGMSRRLSSELRPPALDDLGLAAALEATLNEVARRTGLATTLVAPEDLPPLPPEPGVALFRIAQEALTNVVRHAEARSVEVRLAQADGLLTLSIADDGRGLPAELREGALGLVGMRERATLVGATCEVRLNPGGGTVVVVRVPVQEEAT